MLMLGKGYVSEKYIKSMQNKMMQMQNKMLGLEMKKEINCRPESYDLFRREACIVEEEQQWPH